MPQEKVKAPAIVIIVIAAIGMFLKIINVIFLIFGMSMTRFYRVPARFGALRALMGGGIGFFFAFVSLVVGALIIFGAYKMMKLESYGLALAASILVMIPFLSPCCCLGLPVGIWSIIVLMNDEVKAAFH